MATTQTEIDEFNYYLSLIPEFDGHESICRPKTFIDIINAAGGLASWSSEMRLTVLLMKFRGNACNFLEDRPNLKTDDFDQLSEEFIKYFETESDLQAANGVKIATKNEIKKGTTEVDREFQEVKIESNSQHSQLSQVAISDRCGNPVQHSLSCTEILGSASQKEKKGNNAGIDNEITVQLPPHPEAKPRVSAPKGSVTEKDFPTQNPLPSKQSTHRSFGDIICQESTSSRLECENITMKAQNDSIFEELPLSAKEIIVIGKNELEIKNEQTSELHADLTKNDLALSDCVNDELKVEKKKFCKPHHSTSEIRVRHRSEVDVEELKSNRNVNEIEVISVIKGLETMKSIDNLEMANGTNELQGMDKVMEFMVMNRNNEIVCTQNGSEREVTSIGQNACGFICAEINSVALVKQIDFFWKGQQNESWRNESFGSCSYVQKRSLLCCFEIYGIRLKFSFEGPSTVFQKVLNWRYRKKNRNSDKIKY